MAFDLYFISAGFALKEIDVKVKLPAKCVRFLGGLQCTETMLPPDIATSPFCTLGMETS